MIALRKQAEDTLLDVRCHDSNNTDDAFAKAASTLSNCPSGAEGGQLGWLTHADCAPEFAKELFGHAEVGVLPRLVHSRFGLHVVEVLGREAGVAQPFESVRGAVTHDAEATNLCHRTAPVPAACWRAQAMLKAWTWKPPTHRWCNRSSQDAHCRSA